jgi:hypothetical protein
MQSHNRSYRWRLKLLGAGLLFLATSCTAHRPPASSPPPAPVESVEITLVHGHEKSEWLQAATKQFRIAHPDIAVKLVAKSSLASADAILDGSSRPTLFSPADSTALDLLAEDWVDLKRSELFAPTGADAPQPLLLTPLVFVGWQDRVDSLLKPDTSISWQALHRALAAQSSRDDVSKSPADPAGGRKTGIDRDRAKLEGAPGLHIGHSDPERSNSGLQTLLSITMEYFGKEGFRRDDLLRPKYHEFLETIEKGVVRSGQPYGGTLMADMVRFGPSKYDVAVVYESLAILNLGMGEARWGKLHVYYPSTTIWSDNPVVLLQGDWVSDAQKKAGRLFIEHLRSKPMQQLAFAYGFRPAEPSVAFRTDDASSPFVRLSSKGIRLDVPPASARPDLATVRALLGTWTHVMRGSTDAPAKVADRK